ncbi:MAG TPA: nuclear transport factor 2 family protein [Solirubrobacteraceae bacterium]|nr:nuclear transport factor 2 family protein [Solirubrobacteraceae bacterium]
MELVKRALDAFNRRDLGVYDELFTSDFAGFPSMAGIAESTGYTGHEGFETFLAGLRDTWDEFHLLAEEVRAIGDRVLVLCRIGGRARTTGVQVEGLGAMVFEFRAGRISRARDYLDRSEALRAIAPAE